MGWRDTIKKDESSQPEKKTSWRDTIKEDDGYSKVGSALRGAVQGLTLGFGDEIGAAALTPFVYGAEQVKDLLTGKDENESLKDIYKDLRDTSRDADKEAQKDNTVSYGVGELGGGLATMAVPGLNVAKGATLAGRAGMAATGGALAGAGYSEADNIKDLARDTAIGGALGGALQGAGEKVVAPIFSKVGSWIKESGPTKALGKIFASVHPEVTERYLKRPGPVNAADELEDIGNYFKDDALNLYKQHVGNLDSKAWEVLSEKPTIIKNDIINLGENHIQNILGGKKGNLNRISGTGADADKIKVISQQLDEIKQAFGDKLSESDLKSVVQSIQKLGYSLEGSPRTSLQGQALRELSGVYNDALKTLNPEYAKMMIPVQEATSTLNSLERQFINQQAPEQVDKFVRNTSNFNKSTARQNKEAINAIREMDNVIGSEIENSVKDRLAYDAFNKVDANGSRKTIMGALAGKAVGGVLGGVVGYNTTDNAGGAMLGAMTGFTMDKYAGQAFKQILNGQILASKGMDKVAPYLGKFAGPIVEAAKRGNKAVAATHFILQNSNPEYRELTKKLNDEEEN